MVENSSLSPSRGASNASKMDDPVKSVRRVAVIGAGVSGLVTMKELKEIGLEVVAFESASSIGGVYRWHYDSLTLTSSSATTRFGSRSVVDDSKPLMWTRSQYLEYLGRYAEEHELSDNISFRCQVVAVKKADCDGKWWVHWHRGGDDSHVQTEAFDAVALCCGVAGRPRQPQIKGMESFSGVVQHSSSFTGTEDCASETVVVVGLGESGSDIALIAAQRARRVILSTRRGPGYVIPRLSGNLPSDIDTSRAYHSFPIMRYANPVLRVKRLLDTMYWSPQDDSNAYAYTAAVNARRGLSAFQRFGTKNTSFVDAILYCGAVEKPALVQVDGKRVGFADGSEAIADRIIFCTGYMPSFPEVSDNGKKGLLDTIEPRSLFKRMFMQGLGSDIALIGLVRPGIGSVPPMVEMQARYFALIVRGMRTLPDHRVMADDIVSRKQRDEQRYPEDAEVTRALTDYLSYMDDMAFLIGCRPPLLRLLLTEPFIWYKVMFGPISGLQFRLFGPGAEPDAARLSLRRTPTVGFLIVAYELVVLTVSKAVQSLPNLFAHTLHIY